MLNPPLPSLPVTITVASCAGVAPPSVLPRIVITLPISYPLPLALIARLYVPEVLVILNVPLVPACAWFAPACPVNTVGNAGALPATLAVAIAPSVPPTLSIVIVASLAGVDPPIKLPAIT